MQTFLPYKSFERSAAVLDRQRLGKQRVETMQIMTALLEGRGWVNHPATLMWKNHEGVLLDYQNAICSEWMARGYRDTCLAKTVELYRPFRRQTRRLLRPWWLGNSRFHRSHQSNLVRKDPDHYRQYFPNVPEDLEYVWPTKERAS
jgi:hypothetical protein